MRVIDYELSVNDSGYVLLKIKSPSLCADFVIQAEDAKKLGSGLIGKANYSAAKRKLFTGGQLAGDKV